MPYIPHTEQDIQEMLTAIGAHSIEELFDEIPQHLQINGLNSVPSGLNEMELMQEMQRRARRDESELNFIGAGAYEHHIPAAVWDITTRGEFMTAYTPYQAEASQGTLQLLYEYQSMMASLMGMDVSNASMYEGATALAEAILMAVRLQRKMKLRRILMPTTVNPLNRQAVKTLVSNQQVELIELPYCTDEGTIQAACLQKYNESDITAVVIQQPNFFGALEDVDAITQWAHEHGALVIAHVNPLAMTLFNEPGAWGEKGADIACGDGQPFGVPMASGGPYFGFFTCRQAFVRQMPGRLVGRTTDKDGKTGFALTLQAREQHIRRAKATSNICTNQGLLVTAATIHMSLLGTEGLRRVAAQCHANSRELMQQLQTVVGVEQVFKAPYFHEFAIRCSAPIEQVLEYMATQGIQAGFSLKQAYPELGDVLLICTTETKQPQDIKRYCEILKQGLNQ